LKIGATVRETADPTFISFFLVKKWYTVRETADLTPISMVKVDMRCCWVDVESAVEGDLHQTPS